MITDIYTIGYGNQDIHTFIQNLQSHNIQAVIDIRSRPYSRYRPDFNQKKLKEHLMANGIGYMFQGDKLGGIPKDQELYSSGLPDYSKIRKTIPYQQGLDYLEKGLEFDCKMVLLCACSQYQKCHRYKLVSLDLEQLGYSVYHILKDGSKMQNKGLF